jgi:hypothetical protein
MMAKPGLGLAIALVGLLFVMPAAGAEQEAGSGPPAQEAPKAGVGKEGLVVRSADGGYELKLRGLVQTDGRFFNGDNREPASDTRSRRAPLGHDRGRAAARGAAGTTPPDNFLSRASSVLLRPLLAVCPPERESSRRDRGCRRNAG